MKKMSILKWQKNDLAMTQEIITPECVFLCRLGGGGTHFGIYCSSRVAFKHKA